MERDSWSGKNLREMFRNGTRLLKKNASAVNALNVFPVPDGDTGTNMLLTMQSAMTEANLCSDNDASSVAQAMAKGALMGARGNSGVILSQVLQGIAEGLRSKKSFTGMDMARSLVKASDTAYGAVKQPAEGTILTVIREASEVAQSTSYAGFCDLPSIMESALKEAKESLNRTPELLPVLKESGVVDAGAQGLVFILEGSLLYLRGKELPEDGSCPEGEPIVAPLPMQEKSPTYGYCTEFLIRGNELDLENIRARLAELGDSLLVVGDKTTARVHVHTFDPGAIISYGTSIGRLQQIKVDNMEDQHRDFTSIQAAKPPKYIGKVSTIAVVSGDGLEKVFDSLGATAIIPGGETMNPSVKDLVRAIQSAPTNEVIILPNNPDILPAARQASSLTKKKVSVLPTRTIPQGIAAMMAFNHDSDIDANVKAMAKSISVVHSGQIATSVRSMRYKNLQVREGQIIGFVDEELAVAEYSIEDALKRLMEKMHAQDGEIMTVYYGSNVDWISVQKLFDSIRPQYPHLEIEVIFGGQPHYDYLISVE